MFGLDDAAAGLIVSKAAGGLWDVFAPKPKYTPPRVPWDARKTLFASDFSEQLAQQEERQIDRARLEAGRTGTPLGGAYLDMVGSLGEESEKLFSTQYGEYSRMIEGEKIKWAQQQGSIQAQVDYQGDVSRRAAVGDMIGGIGGVISGSLAKGGAEDRWGGYVEQMVGGEGATVGDAPIGGMLGKMWNYAITEMNKPDTDKAAMMNVISAIVEAVKGLSGGMVDINYPAQTSLENITIGNSSGVRP